MSLRPRLAALELDEDPTAWAALGLDVGPGGRCVVGTTELRLRGGDRGLRGWELRADPAPEPAPAERHALGASAVDHVVVATPDVDRTVAALEGAGLELRGTRESPPPRRLRQAFLPLADALVEVVGAIEPGDGASSLWGLTLVVEDLDAAAELLGDRLGAVRAAVQPGRRIATVRGTEAGITTRLALMTPRPRA